MDMVHQFKKSVSYAIYGLRYIIRREQNFRIQIAVACMVVFAGGYLGIRKIEWIAIIILISAVLILEIINSAIEQFIDIMKPRMHGQVKLVKDMMAAAVLITALSAAFIGTIIFHPYIIELF